MFTAADDHALWLHTLKEAVGRTGWRVHGYVMMRTHYHLLLETPEGNLVEGMKWFQGTFTQRMNASHHTFGHLFQGRYKAKLVEDGHGEYFRRVGDYIHLNPAAAGLLKPKRRPDPLSYRHGSLAHYSVPASKRPDWLSVDRLLAAHGFRDTPAGRKAFMALMAIRASEAAAKGEARLNRGEWREMERGWMYGGAEFRKLMQSFLEEDMQANARRIADPDQRNLHGEAEAERCLSDLMAAMGLASGDLERMNKGAAEKKIIAAYIKRRATVSNQWLSDRLIMGHISSVARCSRSVDSDPALSKRYAELEAMLEKEQL